MTAEQETLLLDVTELKDRVAALEGGTTVGAADVQEELGNINIEVEEIRQEFSFIRGNLEEADFERAQIKDEIQSGADTLQGVSERLDPVEAGLLETIEQLEALTTSLDSASKTAAALEERLTALEGKSTDAAIAAIAKTESKVQDPEDLYAEGFKAIKDNEYRKASDKFTRFIAAYPEHNLADHAQYWLGEIYYAKGDWEKAILEFDKVIKNYPEGDKVPAATLKQGYSFGKLGLTKEAKVLLGHVVEKFPKSDEAVKAKSRLEEMKGVSKN
jgi:tol-pal system protein YbgF